jgi:hypothetical protein
MNWKISFRHYTIGAAEVKGAWFPKGQLSVPSMIMVYGSKMLSGWPWACQKG